MVTRSPLTVRRCAVALAALVLILALTPSLVSAELAIGGRATVASGEPVALRSAPGFDAGVATEVSSGSQVTIADGPLTAADGSLWYQVDAWGQLGYLPAYALGDAGLAAPVEEPWVDPTTGESAPVADPLVQEVAAPAAPVGSGWIAGTDGDGAMCRAGADYASGDLGVLPEGTPVEVAGGQSGEWTPVNCAGTVGYINSAFLSWEQPLLPGAELALTETAVEEPVVEQPVVEAPVVEEIAPPAEPVVESEPVLEPELSVATEDRRRRANNGGGSGSGQAMADFAMQFVGYPYAYAGAGPYAFDCSGFTMYVAQNALGMDITHDMFVQVGMGTPVGFDELQPGDLVFFQNTFQPGLSHAGVYIGGGQMVHAENESTGVKISDINSDYYSSRFYGATRLA